ncbi:MAG: aminomethyltransferase family protein [Gaiellaceae bacterium]
MSSSEIVRTAFDAPQEKLGWEFMEWEGWRWPSDFGDAAGEHRAVREDVGVWEESPLRKWDFRGSDALAATDRIFTNDILGLQVGQVRYAPFCNADGTMVGDGTVLRFGEDYCQAITALDSDLDHFRKVVDGLDVTIEDVSREHPHLQLQGPRSRELLAGLTDFDLGSLGYFRFTQEPVQVGGVPVVVSRTGYSGELGYELFCTPGDAEALWAAVTGAGARPYGLAAVETLRIESGLIFIGYDYFAGETNPFDMSLDKVIRLDGGDFCGKAALEQTAAAPPRRLVTLVLDGGEVPEYGAAITRDGVPAGTLTSPCESPSLGKVIGLAFLEAAVADPGERVEVAMGDGTAGATVETLPLYDPEKKRPRG